MLIVLAGTMPAGADVFVQSVEPLIGEEGQVPAARYSCYDFALTKGRQLVVELDGRGGLDNLSVIRLFDLAKFQRLAAGQKFVYFEGGSSARVQGRTSYRFTVPDDNIYYLMLDNTLGALAARTVRTDAYKIVGGDTDEAGALHDYYAGLYDNEEAADDLGTALLLFADQIIAALNAAKSPASGPVRNRWIPRSWLTETQYRHNARGKLSVGSIMKTI